MASLLQCSTQLYTSSQTSVTMIITLLCIALVPAAVYLRHVISKRLKTGFPLMKLPPEVRLEILKHLVDDEQTIIKAKKLGKDNSSSAIASLRSLLTTTPPPLFTTLTVVNRQLREEFLEVFCQRAEFNFTLDASRTDDGDGFWRMTPRVQTTLRSARIKILATPGLGGGFDPRVVTGSWPLRDRVFDVLESMEKLQDLRLSIQACGNQLWNPIWLWHYTSQSFKESKVRAFKRMSFDLEGWNMREPNHLERNNIGNWEWRCSKNHLVLSDSVGQQPVREFCGALYAECDICDPTVDNGQ